MLLEQQMFLMQLGRISVHSANNEMEASPRFFRAMNTAICRQILDSVKQMAGLHESTVSMPTATRVLFLHGPQKIGKSTSLALTASILDSDDHGNVYVVYIPDCRVFGDTLVLRHWIILLVAAAVAFPQLFETVDRWLLETDQLLKTGDTTVLETLRASIAELYLRLPEMCKAAGADKRLVLIVDQLSSVQPEQRDSPTCPVHFLEQVLPARSEWNQPFCTIIFSASANNIGMPAYIGVSQQLTSTGPVSASASSPRLGTAPAPGHVTASLDAAITQVELEGLALTDAFGERRSEPTVTSFSAQQAALATSPLPKEDNGVINKLVFATFSDDEVVAMLIETRVVSVDNAAKLKHQPQGRPSLLQSLTAVTGRMPGELLAFVHYNQVQCGGAPITYDQIESFAGQRTGCIKESITALYHLLLSRYPIFAERLANSTNAVEVGSCMAGLSIKLDQRYFVFHEDGTILCTTPLAFSALVQAFPKYRASAENAFWSMVACPDGRARLLSCL
jgi:hypothetical protein